MMAWPSQNKYNKYEIDGCFTITHCVQLLFFMLYRCAVMMHHYKTYILSLLDYDAFYHNLGSNTMNLYCCGNLKSYSQTRRREESRGMSSSS